MSKLSVGSIQRAARITSLILGVVPILVFLGFTIQLLIAKYYALPPYGLTWFDIKIALGSQLSTGLVIGGPLLIARFVAERKPLVGAIIMLILAIPFILIPIMAWETENWAAAIGSIYVVPALLYLVSWRRGRLQHIQTSSSRTGQSAT
jgi:uncharacterized membrane protein